MIKSYIWLRPTILWSQSGIIRQTYHQLEADAGRVEKCGWGRDADGQSRRVGRTSESGWDSSAGNGGYYYYYYFNIG